MADKEIKLKITAKDDASKVVDALADDVEAVEKPDHEVVLTAQDDASTVVKDVQTDTETLTKEDWTVVLKAKIDAAQASVKDLKADIQKLEDGDYKATLDADITGAQRSLDTLDGKVRGTSKSVDGTIRNLGGPAGPMAGVVGDWSESLSTVGEIASTQLGLGEAAASRLALALGVGGALFGAATVFWSSFQSGAKHAKEQVQQLIAVQEQLAAGETNAALKSFIKDNKANIDALKKTGLSAADAWDLVTGKLSIADAQAKASTIGSASLGEMQSIKVIGEDLQSAWDKAGLALESAQFDQFDLAKAMNATNDELFEQAKKAMPLVRDEILGYIADVNDIPAEKLTAIKADANPDDIAQVEALLAELTRDREVTIRTRAVNSRADPGLSAALGGPGAAVAQPGPGGPSREVHVHLHGSATYEDGRKAVQAIKDFERTNGAGWRS